MCTILGWTGTLPQGLLTHLLLRAETRGRDATGIAFREGTRSVAYRRSVNAGRFVKEHKDLCGQARRSAYGIAHTRRTSPGNPINNRNSHPYPYFQYVFAHNGRIRNFVALKQDMIERCERNIINDPENPKLQKLLKYLKGCTSDSMVLGPCIESRDFREAVGDMGLVWMAGNNVWCMRSAKELTAAYVRWWPKDKKDEAKDLVIAASTEEIVESALIKTPGIEFEYSFYELQENHVYRLAPDNIYDEGEVPVNPNNERDLFSSNESSTPATASAS